MSRFQSELWELVCEPFPGDALPWPLQVRSEECADGRTEEEIFDGGVALCLCWDHVSLPAGESRSSLGLCPACP